MRKRLFFTLIVLILCAARLLVAEVTLEKVIVHCKDQENKVSNDPKWIYGETNIGQTFIPSKNFVSYLRAIIYRQLTLPGTFKGDAHLEIRLWECKENYNSTKKSLPIVFTTDQQKPAFAERYYFLVNGKVEAGKPYYFEFSSPMAPERCYYFWYQYRGDPYPKGDYVVNGQRRANCDLNFTTFYPVELKNGQILNDLPVIFEVHLSEKVALEGCKIFISGPTGTVTGKVSGGTDAVVYLGPLDLDTYELRRIEYRLMIQVKNEKGEWQNFTIPFVYEKSSSNS
ncbi:MAG: hypothetical protein WDA18_09455 [Candidatus Ratteibacteria bacterium]